MSRLLLLITLFQVLIPGNFVLSSLSRRKNHLKYIKEEGKSVISSHLGKRNFNDLTEVSQGHSSRSRTDSTLTETIQETATLTGEPDSNKSDSSIEVSGNVEEIKDNDPFTFDPLQLDDKLFPVNNGFESLEPFTIATGLFRADIDGKTVIIDSDNSMEFQSSLLSYCDVNPFFIQLSSYKLPHFFKQFDSENIQIDLEFDGNVPIVAPPLHRLYELAREVLVYAVGRGQTQIIREAVDAGINLNFNILYKPTNNRMNLLHFAAKLNRNPEVLKLLVEIAKIDPNALDSFGLAPLHYLAGMKWPMPSVMALLEVGANPNIISVRPDFNAPIHISMMLDNYSFLKPFIYFPTVDINLRDYSGNNLVHMAIKRRVHSCFLDLLNHPRILLDFQPLKLAFALITKYIPENDRTKYFEALSLHVMKRKRVHSSHLHYIIFQLIISENIAALEAFHRQGFKFDFVHKSERGRPDSCPLILAVRRDCLESFKFLQSIGIPVTENEIMLLAIKSSSLKIISHLLSTTTFTLPDNELSQCIKQITALDRADIFELFIGKYGRELIVGYVEDVEFDDCPSIFEHILFKI